MTSPLGFTTLKQQIRTFLLPDLGGALTQRVLLIMVITGHSKQKIKCT